MRNPHFKRKALDRDSLWDMSKKDALQLCMILRGKSPFAKKALAEVSK
jgi:hypothetical protein